MRPPPILTPTPHRPRAPALATHTPHYTRNAARAVPLISHLEVLVLNCKRLCWSGARVWRACRCWASAGARSQRQIMVAGSLLDGCWHVYLTCYPTCYLTCYLTCSSRACCVSSSTCTLSIIACHPRARRAMTYTGAFGPIRDWFASLPEAKASEAGGAKSKESADKRHQNHKISQDFTVHTTLCTAYWTLWSTPRSNPLYTT